MAVNNGNFASKNSDKFFYEVGFYFAVITKFQPVYSTIFFKFIIHAILINDIHEFPLIILYCRMDGPKHCSKTTEQKCSLVQKNLSVLNYELQGFIINFMQIVQSNILIFIGFIAFQLKH